MDASAGLGPIVVDTVASTRASIRRRRSEHPFYVGSAIFALVVSLVAFLPGIIDPSLRNGPTNLLVVVHGLSVFGWLALYLTQTILAATGRLANHRRHGLVAALLTTVIVVSGVFVTLEAARRGADFSGDLVRWSQPHFVDQLIFAFGDILIFGGLVTAALLYRRRPEAHKRLMYFAIVGGLIAAPFVHLVGHFAAPPAITSMGVVALLIASGIHDKVVRGRVHPVSWIAPPLIIAFALARTVLLSSTSVWPHFVGWWAAIIGR